MSLKILWEPGSLVPGEYPTLVLVSPESPLHYGSAFAHFIGKTFFSNQSHTILMFATKCRLNQRRKLRNSENQWGIKF